jgi:hypothetical protein
MNNEERIKQKEQMIDILNKWSDQIRMNDETVIALNRVIKLQQNEIEKLKNK